MNIIEAMEDPNLFGPWFEPIEDWRTWQVVLKATYGLPMTDADLDTFKAITGRSKPPSARVDEVWLACGRRGGKSRIISLIAAYEAAFVQHRLSRGERGVIPVTAQDQDQASVIFSYVRSYFEEGAVLRGLLVNATSDELELVNNVVVRIKSASFRGIRGFTLLCAICDEISFWMLEGANPAGEILRAMRPGLATTRGMLLCLSSPHGKSGPLYEASKELWGVDDGRALFVQGASRTFNPTLDEAYVAREAAKDPAAAVSEWFGRFRDDVATFLPAEWVDNCTRTGPATSPPSRAPSTWPSSILLAVLVRTASRWR